MEEIKVIYNERQRAEEHFHDARSHLSEGDGFNRNMFCAKTSPETLFALSKIMPLRGKDILDLGCGSGEAAIYFAWEGATVDALDISMGALSILKKRSSLYGLEDKINVIKGVAEDLPGVSGKYDVVFGNGVLHHVDIEGTISGVYRVLKKGGLAIFIEPLSYNPVIKIYRVICKNLRSQHENPLRYTDIMRMRELYSKEWHREFQLSTLLIFVYFFLSGVNPNKVRYWKKIILEEDRYGRVFNLLSRLDNIILRVIPFMKRFCWNIVVVLEK